MWIMKYIGKYRTVDYLFRKAISTSLYVNLFRKSKGKNYYVICRRQPAGFFSDYFYVLGHMILADKMKLVPYVDMINYPSLYSEPNDINGTKNSWEYYFEPYNHISGEEVYKDSFCISEEKYPYQWVLHYSTTNLFNEGFPTRKRVAKLNRYIMKYIKIHDELINEFQKDVDSLKITDCVGVHIRGTDMKNTKGHIKPMDVENVIDKLNGLADKHGISRIFLCTDEEYIKNRVFTAFEGKIEVCCLNAYRTTNHTQGLHWETTPNIVRENHKYQLGVEVLKDAYLLSKCKALVCGNSNVAYAAIVFNNNQYEWIACE